MAVDFDHNDKAGLVKVIQKANTGSPGILADKIIASDWFSSQLEGYAMDQLRDEEEHNFGE